MKRIEMVAQARHIMNETLAILEPDKDRILHTPITAYTLLLAERALNFRENIIERMAANPDMTEERAMEEFMTYHEAVRRIKKADKTMEEESEAEETEEVSHYCECCLQFFPVWFSPSVIFAMLKIILCANFPAA